MIVIPANGGRRQVIVPPADTARSDWARIRRGSRGRGRGRAVKLPPARKGERS